MISKQICENILEKHLGISKSEFYITSSRLVNFSKNAQGFLGEHHSLQIAINNSGETKIYTFFVKTIPESDEFKSYVEEIGVFQKELQLYGQLLTELEGFSSKPWSPKCYYTIVNKAIVLEDLRVKQYNTLDYRKYFNLKHAVSFMKSLARFHSTSIAYEETRKVRIMEQFGNLLQESGLIFDNKHVRSFWLKNNSNAFLTASKLLPNYDPDITETLRDLFYDLPNLIKPSKIYRNMIGHGDLWCNNIMFNNSGHSILVDFQFCRFAIPTHDIFVALYLTTSPEFRREHLSSVLDVYYETMREELKFHSLDLETFFSKEDFAQCCRISTKVGLLESALQTMLVYFRSEDVGRIFEDPIFFKEYAFGNKNDFVVEIFHKDPVFAERIQNIYTELILEIRNK